MRLIPKRRQPNRNKIATEKTISAPVGGWNARDPIGTAGPADAHVLDNCYPRPAYIDVPRAGFSRYATNMPEDVKTMAPCILQTGISVLLVFSDTGVTRATFGGEYSGRGQDFEGVRTSGRHQWVQFGDGTNTWIIAVNGVDKPFYYKANTGTHVLVDGVSSPAITGITTTDIVSVAVFKSRLLFIRNSKLGFDYLPAGAAGGAASYYDLSPFATKGGYLMVAFSWSRDAGNGPDDYAVFVTSEGQALVYSGTDPSSANTWALVGVYDIGRPLGRKCVSTYGADPIILTENGLFPLSALLMSGDERRKFALSYKIEEEFSKAAKLYYSHIGWQVISFPKEDAIVVNIPIEENGRHDQYVMNTISKAWCRFTGINAEEWVIHKAEYPSNLDSHLLFSKGRQIYKMFDGTSDDGAAITAEVQQAYSDFGTPYLKEPLMYMPVFTEPTITAYQAGISTDFEDRAGFASSTVPTSNVLRWGIGKWGINRWGRSNRAVRQWGGVAAWPGRWLAGKLKLVTDSQAGKWVGSVIRFNVGGGL